MIQAKQITRVAALMFCMAALFSCTKDVLEDEIPGGGTIPGASGDMLFDIRFAPQTKVATGRDFKSEWENGDAIGIFAVVSGQELTAQNIYKEMKNVRLTYTETAPGDPSTGSWNLDNGVQLWFPSGGGKLDMYGYYPYDASVTDPTAIAFTVLTDQSGTININGSDRSNYSLSDLLTASSDNGGNGWGKDNGPVVITFSHALAMVEVILDNSAGAVLPNEEVSVTLRKIRPSVKLDLGAASGPEITLKETDNAATSIRMYRVEQEDDTDYHSRYTFRALVPAQELDRGSSMAVITIGDNLLQSSVLNADIPLTGGEAEQFTQVLPILTHRVRIPAAGKTFEMGSPSTEPGRDTDETHHQVTLTQDFYMGKYLVTNAQYAAFLNEKGVGEDGKGMVKYFKDNFTTPVEEQHVLVKTSPTTNNNRYHFGVKWDGIEGKWLPAEGCELRPVVYVTWYGAKAYAEWVGGDLPTEAEWEFACRAGTTERYYFGDNPSQLGIHEWFLGNNENAGYAYGTKPVGLKTPNSYGLYDMHGNASEWCLDWYDSDYGIGDFSTPAADPRGPQSGYMRVLRGGSWLNEADGCRSAFRDANFPDDESNYDSFRVVFKP